MYCLTSVLLLTQLFGVDWPKLTQKDHTDALQRVNVSIMLSVKAN